jgi:hypothetical protein
MIDTIYKLILTLLSKDRDGTVTPTEFNLVAHQVQQEIFRGYFEDFNRDKNRESKGLTNRGYGNLAKNERDRIQQFAVMPEDITGVSGVFNLPTNLYLIEDEGVVTASTDMYPLTLIDEVERGKINVINKSLAKPTRLYPVYEKYKGSIVVSPNTITKVNIRYIKKPSFPNWTYFMLTSGEPMFNPADPSFQDFELHYSEFANITIKILSYFGITIREEEIVKAAELFKDKNNLKENN